ncbi:MAG: cation diffusion facilitator family transporter [Actinomycetota bacterium]
MSHEPHDGDDHEHFGPADAATLASREGTRATWISLGLLALTAVLQLGIVVISGSVALLADTIHNFTDALTAIPLLIAFRLARRAPTRRYPYGYHRAEDVAGLTIVALIAISALLAAAEAIQRLVHPQPIQAAGWVLAAGALGFLGNEAVAQYRIRIGKRIGSAALVADGMHARTDGLASLGVVVATIGVLLGFERADALVGLAITVAIVFTMWRAAKTVLHRALDGTDESTLSLIEAVAGAVTGVEHVEEARARWSGHRLLADLAVVVAPALTVEAGHAIAQDVHDALLREVPRLADATVHVDPHAHEAHGSTGAP